jgi:hypothetical protein
MRRVGVRYIFCYMTNRFGFELHPQDIRWAAAEGVSQDVIAAVLLLHERSVDEIAPQLTARELEQTIVLVGRSPRLYAPGTLEALESKKATLHVNASVVARENAAPLNRALPERREASIYAGAGKPWGHHAQPPSGTPSAAQRRPPEQIKRGEASGAPAELKTAPRPAKSGTRPGTETGRRRLIVDDFRGAGLTIRQIADVTGISRSLRPHGALTFRLQRPWNFSFGRSSKLLLLAPQVADHPDHHEHSDHSKRDCYGPCELLDAFAEKICAESVEQRPGHCTSTVGNHEGSEWHPICSRYESDDGAQHCDKASYKHDHHTLPPEEVLGDLNSCFG